ncbi:MAG: HEAT repeat domain-containing protein, partial [Anaerolineales bacterium]|nr:HEAT repeat domain-containing protein [Anaerolineales bacterium]
MKGLTLDPISLALGFITGIVAAIFFGWLIRPLKWVRDRLQKRAGRLEYWISGGVEGRYREHLVKFTQQQHLGSRVTTLESIFVPCRLLIPPPEPQPETGEILPTSQLNFLWPEMASLVPVRKPTSISLAQMLELTHRAALIAPDGGGKSATMAFLALKIARQDTMFSSTRLPIYVHLSEIELVDPNTTRKQKSVEDPLIKAVQGQDKRLSSRSLYTVLKNAIHEMRAVILIDGWEELEPGERNIFTEWIEKLVNAYPENQFILTGPIDGYGPLMEMDFIPLWFENWGLEHTKQLARRWVKALGLPEHADINSDQTGDDPPIPLDFWRPGQLPIDISMSLWLASEGEHPATNRADLYRTTIQKLLAPLGSGDISWPLEIGENVYCRLAHELKDSSFITRQQLRQTIRDVLKSMDKKSRRIERECLKALGQKSSLLIQRRKERMVFRSPTLKHFFWSSYCANLEQEAIGMIEKWPASKLAVILEFLFELSEPGNVIEKLLTAPHGYMYDNLFIAAHSIREIPGNMELKRKILVQMARLMANPQAPMALRERAVAALVGTKDEGIVYLLCKAAKSTDETMRILAAPGLGALAAKLPGQAGSAKALQALFEGSNEETEPIRSIYIHALASTRSQSGLDRTIRILVEGKIDARRIAAEALGQIGNQGRKILLEALDEKDAQVRRAALFGIAGFPGPWAKQTLKKVLKKDNDWHVSSTAEDLIAEQENTDPALFLRQPLPENMGWLISWAAKRGAGVPVGERAFAVLERVIGEAKEPELKAASARTLGDICRESFISTIEDSLNDPHPLVREAA